MTVLEHSGTKALSPTRVQTLPFDANLLFYPTSGGQTYSLNVPSNYGYVQLNDAFEICAKHCDDLNQAPENWVEYHGAPRNSPGALLDNGAVLCENIVIIDTYVSSSGGNWNCQFWAGTVPTVAAEAPSTFPSYVYRRQSALADA